MEAIGDGPTQATGGVKVDTGKSWPDRILALADDDQPDSRRIKLDSLLLVLLLGLVLEFSQIYLGPGPPSSFYLRGALGLSIPALLLVSHRGERIAPAMAFAVMLVIVVSGFPGQPNHYLLPLLIFLMLSVLDLEKEDDRLLAIEAVRWLTVIVLFLTGFQKVVYGTYFHGEYLGWKVTTSERFSQFFAHLLPPEELTRLRSLDGENFGSGVYRPRSVVVVVISNLVYLVELAAPVFLLLKKTRSAATLVTVIFILMVEIGAREYYFGILFVSMVLMFAKRNWIRWLAPVVLTLAALSLANRLWNLLL